MGLSTVTKAVLFAGAQAVLAEALALPVPDVPVPATPAVTIAPINTKRFVCFVKHFGGNEQYSRRQYEIEIGPTGTLDFHTTQLGGTIFALGYPRYDLFLDGAFTATYFRKSTTEKVGKFALPRPLPAKTTGGDPRQRRAVIVAKDAAGQVVAAESTVPCLIVDNQDGLAGAQQTHVGVQNASHDWDRGKPFSANVEIPLALTVPRHIPHTLAPAKEFTNQPAGSDLVLEMVVPGCETNNMTTHYLGTRLSGVRSTANIHGYFRADLERAYPVHSSMDGVRGIATMRFALSLKPNRHGGCNYTDGWSRGTFTTDGTRTTKFGIRHKWPIDWTEASLTHPAVEFVGICLDPTIPLLERYPDHCWSWDYDPESLRLSGGARPVDPITGEDPHPGDVRSLLTDRRGWIWENLTPGNQFDGPVSYRRHLKGQLDRPFASRWVPGTRDVLISEEGGKRISRWDGDTFAYRGNEVEGLPHAPQDMAIWRDWLYFSMFERAPGMLVGMVCRKKLNTAPTAPYEVVAIPTLLDSSGEGSRFCSFSINDNTLDADGRMPKGGGGPDGTLALQTFHNAQGALPQFFVPTAAGVYSEWNAWHSHGYNLIQGRGPTWANLVYPCSSGVAFGRWWFSSSINCLYVLRHALATDPPALTNAQRAQITRGHEEYLGRGLDLVHGLYGYGFLPPLFGLSANIDAFLVANGHVKA